MEIGFGFIIATFIAGLLTFLAPCTLPLVPAYLGFISGVRERQSGIYSSRERRKIWHNGLAYVLGFSLIFILFGFAAGYMGQLFAQYQIWLSRIGGVFVILLGLYLLGIFSVPWLVRVRTISIPSWLEIGSPLSSFVIGMTFAVGWTPCVGPILGTVLLLAGSSATAITGALLLAVFSFGLAIPFLVIAYGVGWSTRFVRVATIYLPIISRISGAFLLLIGILLVTNNFAITIELGYRLFNFINYERLMDFL